MKQLFFAAVCTVFSIAFTQTATAGPRLCEIQIRTTGPLGSETTSHRFTRGSISRSLGRCQARVVREANYACAAQNDRQSATCSTTGTVNFRGTVYNVRVTSNGTFDDWSRDQNLSSCSQADWYDEICDRYATTASRSFTLRSSPAPATPINIPSVVTTPVPAPAAPRAPASTPSAPVSGGNCFTVMGNQVCIGNINF